MMIKKLVVPAFLLVLSSFANANNDAEFEVKDIQVKGLQRVALGVALTHIPIKVGDTLNDFRVAQAVKKLFKSGHFNNIVVSRDGNRIIFEVNERETISEITFDGNKDLKDEQLSESLDDNNIRIGETVDRTVLANLELGLEDFYHSIGKYNIDIKTEVSRLPRNRVKLHIDFDEGDAAKIDQINIVGNELFTDEELLSKIELKFNSPWWDLFAQDRYQKRTLEGDLETIENHYLDRGYLRYKVESSQVSVTPNKKGVYITLNVDEGEQYTVSDVEFIGDMRGFENLINAINPIQKDTLYNGALVTYTENNITQFLGRYGYAYPKVTTIPDINDEDKTVKLSISVDVGKRIYVNRINIVGNGRSSEEIFRREMRQMEGAWLSNSLVESSKSRIQRIPYVEKVDFQTKQIPGEDDLVDIDFSIDERSSGTFTAGIGYGSFSGTSLNVGIQENNFLGTGNRLGLNINTISYSRSATISYTEPYFTIDGISLGGSVFYNEFDASNANLERYNNKTYGVTLNWGFPINEYVRVNFGVDYRVNGITRSGNYEQILKYYDIYGDRDNTYLGLDIKNFGLNAAISRSTLNRGTFPSAGSSQRLSGKITTPNSDVNYFKLDFDARWYTPLSTNQRWTLLTRLELGYGNGYGSVGANDHLFPFWENFRAGGHDSLRGFENNEVGPKSVYRQPGENFQQPGGLNTNIIGGSEFDTVFSTRRSIGGNAKIIGGVEVIFPIPFIDEGFSTSLRSSLFVDIGSVWDTEFNLDEFRDLDDDQFALIDDYSEPGRYRSSAGLSLQWLSPMGPMLFSWAKPIKKEDGDRTSFFSFNVGSTF